MTGVQTCALPICISKFHDQKEPAYPFNSLLVSSPGWGKSFLAKCLANHFNMSYMEFSLSQMATTNDLIDCFDSICSHQNRSQNKVLVFMDEINCEIEGTSAMGLLLSPIWDGSFIRNGKFYRLLPAVWIFASTESLDKLSEHTKGPDFISRLNGPIVKLDSLDPIDFIDSNKASSDMEITETLELSNALEDVKKVLVSDQKTNIYKDKNYTYIIKHLPEHIKTEQVYLGVSLLNRLWGPISEIHRDILVLFHDILPINGFRSMEFFVSKFQDIQRGVVDCSNAPSLEKFPELKRHIVLPSPEKRCLSGKSGKDKHEYITIETIVK